MNYITFNPESASQAPEQRINDEPRLLQAIKELSAVNSYDHDAAFIHAPADTQMRSSIHALIQKKSKHSIDTILLVGIGGSNLAVKAVYELLSHTKKESAKTKRILFAESVDPEYTKALYQEIETVLAHGKNVLLVIATKSGLTTETIALGSLFLECLKRHYKAEYHNYVVTITDEHSPLASLAVRNGYDQLIIPERIGGRYSAMSAVGLFPLGLAGYDIDALCAGALIASRQACMLPIEKNEIAMSTAVTYGHYKAGVRISNIFLFAADAQSLGAWYRQLIAESLGKIQTIKNKKEGVGILPIVSIGSTDLHSMVQLYFARPVEILTTFVTFGSAQDKLKVPRLGSLEGIDTLVAGKSIAKILSAIEKGTMDAYGAANLPFVRMHMANKSEESIGQFMQWKMIETVMLARLLEINPFDQPEVERYKNNTRKILENE